MNIKAQQFIFLHAVTQQRNFVFIFFPPNKNFMFLVNTNCVRLPCQRWPALQDLVVDVLQVWLGIRTIPVAQGELVHIAKHNVNEHSLHTAGVALSL